MISALLFSLMMAQAAPSDELQWKGADGKPVASSPSRKSIDGFGGMLLVTGDADWKEKWMTPSATAPVIGEITSISRGKSLNVLIFFSNPKVDKATGKAEIRCNIDVIRPDGKTEVHKIDQPCFAGDPGPNLNHLFLANQAVGFIAEPGDPKGQWSVKVALEDKNRKVRLDLETSFTLK